MNTRKFCPKCGRPVVKSRLNKSINKYVFQCYGCQEDFYRFEILRKSDQETIDLLRKNCIKNEIANGGHFHSVYKPYPRINNY